MDTTVVLWYLFKYEYEYDYEINQRCVLKQTSPPVALPNLASIGLIRSFSIVNTTVSRTEKQQTYKTHTA